MDYKKKYEEALENLKKIRNANENNKELVDFIDYNYPELKESEDEKIRKELWEYFHNMQLSSDCDFSPSLTMDDILAYLERQKEQKLAWSENVKRMFIKALERVEEQNNKGYKLTDCDKNSWWEDFKTYCGYTEMQRSVWSEEDENMIEDIIEAIDTQYAVSDYNDMVSWLKSLKKRYIWKPSDEQTNALYHVVSKNLMDACRTKDDVLLEQLLNDLMKLKGE